MLSWEFSVIINCGISAPGHIREVVDEVNAIDKSFPFQLIPTLQLKGAKIYHIHMAMHTGTCAYDASLTREYQKDLSTVARKYEVIDQLKCKKSTLNKNGKKGNIMFKMMLMLCTKMLKCFIILTSFHHFHFVVHTQNHMVSEG